MRGATAKLFHKIRQAQEGLLNSLIIAPCLGGDVTIRARVKGLLYTFKAQAGNFEGWGVFRPVAQARARWEGEATPDQIALYRKKCTPQNVQLIRPIWNNNWLAYSANQLRIVCLVENGVPWMEAVAVWDGNSLWFEGPMPNAEPLLAERMQRAMGEQTPPHELRIAGLTPAHRNAYTIEFLRRYPPVREVPRPPTDDETLRRALARGGGSLLSFTDRRDTWLVSWRDSDGETHTSVVRKDDMTVENAGVCLSGQDRKFDLTSLVGVVEGFDLY